MKKNVIFDVCWTLFRTSTTFSFIDFSLTRLNRKSHINFFLRCRIVKLFLVLVGKLLGFDLYRHAYIYLLKGLHKNIIEDLAEKYVEDYLMLRKINQTFELLDYYKSNVEFNVLLSSASLDVVIKPLAYKLGINYHASNLGFDDFGFCTGLLENDLLGSKDKSIYNLKSVYMVVTDNLSDLKLIRKSENYFIISSRKNAIFWARENIVVDFFLD